MPLYDPQGRPIPELPEAAPATGVHVSWEPSDRYTTDASRSLTPARVDAILTAANSGDTAEQSKLALELEEKSWDIAQAVQTRRLAVAGLEWELLPPEGDDSARAKEIAEETEAMLRSATADSDDSDTFQEAMFFTLQGALLPGFAVAELIWGEGGRDLLGCREIEQRHFSFTNSRTPLLVTTNEPNGVSLPPSKFVTHYHRARPGARCRGGLIRPLAWLHCFSSFSAKNLLTFVERYGMPFLLTKVSREAWTNDRQKLAYLVKNFGPAGGGVFTDGVEAELLQAANNTGDVYFRLLEYMGDAITKVVLGQTATSGDGGGLSKDNAQGNVRQDILESDSHALESTLRAQVLRPRTHWTHGPDAPVPRLHLKCEPPEDLKAKAETAQILSQAGLEWDAEEASEQFGMTLTRAGAAVAEDGDVVAGEAIQDTALNGAQVKSLVEIVGQVAQGNIPRETGVQIIAKAFQIDEAEANKLMGKVGNSFVPAPPAGTAGFQPASSLSAEGSLSPSPLDVGSSMFDVRRSPLPLSSDLESIEDIHALALSRFLRSKGLADWFGPLQSLLDDIADAPDEATFRSRALALVADLPALSIQLDSAALETLLQTVLATAAATGQANRAAELARKEQ